MVVIRELPLLGRPIRAELDLVELGQSTFEKLKEAIGSADQQLALALADYLYWEGKGSHDSYTDWAFAGVDWIARHEGEEAIPGFLRFVRGLLEKSAYLRVRTRATAWDKVLMHCESQRGHRAGPRELGEFRVWEEVDRYVMEFDPCGSGGRMARGPIDGTGSRVGPPYNLGRTSKPYPWTWGKSGVPYYCVHCCVWAEIMAIESVGYPSRINECDFGDANKPGRWYFYKSPDLIPEEYFERVGFKKDPAKFKR